MRGNHMRINNFKAKLIDRIANLNPDVARELRALQTTGLPWYIIRNQADEPATDVENDTTEVFIYDEIGGSFGVDANVFVQELSLITTPNIKVRINSPGGNVFDSIAIRNSLLNHPANVITFIDALAASGASIVALGGDEIVMMPGSQMMIHDAMGLEMGNAKEMRAMADFLDRQSDNIAGIYAGKAGGDIPEWRDKMLAETWMFADEAIELGLADRQFVPGENQPVDVPAEEDPAAPEDCPEGQHMDENGVCVPDEPAPPGDPNADEEHDVEALTRILMGKKHDLSKYKYKYAGRNKAPSPLSTDQVDTDALVNVLRSLGNRKVNN
jgi:ATP-dependent protease ClpP protease subunit